MKGSRAAKNQMKKFVLDGSPESAKLLEDSMKELTGKMVNQGMPPKDAMGISNQMLEGIYAQAYRLYNTGKYVEATHLFRMLILFDPYDPKNVLGLAACFHMLKEYKNAIQTYTMCAVLDPQNPLPHYHSSDCFIQMKDLVSAVICLEMAVNLSNDKAEYSKLKERALLSLDSIRNQLSNQPKNE